MKKGIDHLNSAERRGFDITISTLLLPTKTGMDRVVHRLIKNSCGLDLPAVFEEQRVGKDHQTFPISKYRLRHPDTDELFGPWADAFLRLGLDEWAQLSNIRRGNMSLTGPRPITAPYYDEVRDGLPPRLGCRWDFVIGAQKPGMYGSYSLDRHTREADDPNEPEIRAEADIKDFEDASMRHDVALTAKFISVVVGGKLK